MTTPAPEVTDQGLALWRLHRAPEQYLRCLVGTFERKLILAIRSEGKMLLVESHMDILDLVARADMMKAAYVAQGWAEFDSEQDDR